jgi:hypothetical protein
MSDHLLIATRKGLFALERERTGWVSRLIGFDGVAVTNVLGTDGVIYAALKHGHFGAKLHRSDDDGATWRELTAPAFPADAADTPSLFQIWTMEIGGQTQPDRLWIGAIPAGLFSLRRSRRKLAARLVAVERAGAQALVRRRL